MNKYLGVIAGFFLFAGCALAIETTDEQEVAQLSDSSALFADFCLQTKEHIRQDLAAKGKSLVPQTVLDLLSDTANRHKNVRARLESILGEAGNEVRRLDEALIQKISDRKPLQPNELVDLVKSKTGEASGSIKSFFDNREAHLKKVDEFMAERQRALGQGFQDANSRLSAFLKKSVENLHSAAEQSKVWGQKVQEQGAQNLLKNAVDGIKTYASKTVEAQNALRAETCATFDRYHAEAEARFEAAKRELVAVDPRVASLELKDVACASVERVEAVRKACAKLNAAQ